MARCGHRRRRCCPRRSWYRRHRSRRSARRTQLDGIVIHSAEQDRRPDDSTDTGAPALYNYDTKQDRLSTQFAVPTILLYRLHMHCAFYVLFPISLCSFNFFLILRFLILISTGWLVGWLVGWCLTALSARLVAWHSGRTSVSDRRTFAVLRSTCG